MDHDKYRGFNLVLLAVVICMVGIASMIGTGYVLAKLFFLVYDVFA